MKHKLIELERRLKHAAGDAWCISTDYYYGRRDNPDYDDDEAERLEELVAILGNAARDVETAIKVIEAVQISEECDAETRYAWGNREADNLTAKLRGIDPTVKVTYTVDSNGKDKFIVTCSAGCGAYYEGAFETVAQAEEYFRRFHGTDEETEDDN